MAPPTISANVWFNGSYCPNGGVNLTAALDNKYTVYIGGNYLGRNNTNIGSSSFKFAQATIVGICKKQSTVQTCSDSPNSQVYAYPPYGTSTSPLAKPDTNAANIYGYGTATPAVGAPTVNWNAPTCTTGSFTFDNNTTMDDSLPTAMLFSGSNFSCTVKDSAGDLVGSLAWDNPTKTLTIDGTIFIDGDINMPSGTLNYKGNGTIYINGSLNGGGNFSGTGHLRPCLDPAGRLRLRLPRHIGTTRQPIRPPPAPAHSSSSSSTPTTSPPPSTCKAADTSGTSPSSSSRASPATAAPPSSARSSPTAAAWPATSASTFRPFPPKGAPITKDHPVHRRRLGRHRRQLETAQVTGVRSRRFFRCHCSAT